MRAEITASAGHVSEPIACCASIAASTPSTASAKAACAPSPVVFTIVPPWASTARADERVMTRQCRPHRLGLFLPQTRRALDVSEQERHCSRRRPRHEANVTATELFGARAPRPSPAPEPGFLSGRPARLLRWAAGIGVAERRARVVELSGGGRTEDAG